jgi:hypothetical protein
MLQMTDERVQAGLFQENLFLLHKSVVKTVIVSRLEMCIHSRETSLCFVFLNKTVL